LRSIKLGTISNADNTTRRGFTIGVVSRVKNQTPGWA
jgi:hypothetical protein